MTTNDKEAIQAVARRSRRRMAIHLNVWASCLLAGVLVLLVNLFASHYYLRADLSGTGAQALSPKTRHILEAVQEPVDVVVFYQRNQAALREIEVLLRAYSHASRQIRFAYVDPDRNMARTEELARLYGVDRPNVVLFHQGGRVQQVTSDEIATYDVSSIGSGIASSRMVFAGERAFSSALYAVTQAESPVIYFLSGHGQRQINNFDPYVGYSEIGKRIAQDHMEVRELVLGAATRIPQDCAVLVIAGPTRRISQPELDLIDDYLERSGRVLILVDAFTRTGLESVLTRWGVQLGDDLVVDMGRTLTGRELYVTDYAVHPVTDAIRGVTTVFHAPRSVAPLPRAATGTLADKPQVSVLASSSEAGWAERDPERLPRRFDPGVDVPGPIPVAVAVERGPVPGIDIQIRPTRMVVVGDSGFVTNGALTGGDEDFLLSALNWLLDRNELMAMGPKSISDARIALERRQLHELLVLLVVGMPCAALLLGGLVLLRRRK